MLRLGNLDRLLFLSVFGIEANAQVVFVYLIKCSSFQEKKKKSCTYVCLQLVLAEGRPMLTPSLPDKNIDDSECLVLLLSVIFQNVRHLG